MPGNADHPKNLFRTVLVVFAFLFLAGCADFGGRVAGPSPAPTTAPATTPVPATAGGKTLDLAVYYVKVTSDDAYLVREVHKVPYTKEVANAAMEELVHGQPTTPGAVRVLPAATRIRGISIHDGLATVDFSRDVLGANVGSAGEALGIQSIVDTLTEFPSIHKVSFLVEGQLDQGALDWWGHVGLYGQPFTRDLSKVYEPAIWVTDPRPGQKVGSPISVRGSARVFEAVVNASLQSDAGQLLATGRAMAANDASGRGDFVLVLPFTAPAGSGTLTVYEVSPKDGKAINQVVVPLTWDRCQ